MALDQYDVDKETEKETYEVKRVDEMSFWEHLDELRKRLIRSFIALAVTTIGIFSLGDWVFENIIYAPRNPSFITYNMMCKLGALLNMSSLCIHPVNFEIFTTEMGEPFFKQTQVAIVLGLIVASPYIFYQFCQPKKAMKMKMQMLPNLKWQMLYWQIPTLEYINHYLFLDLL